MNINVTSLLNSYTDKHILVIGDVMLDKYILGNKVQLGSGNSISDKLKTLNELYKSGALTKEEFEKAKKKLLN